MLFFPFLQAHLLSYTSYPIPSLSFLCSHCAESSVHLNSFGEATGGGRGRGHVQGFPLLLLLLHTLHWFLLDCPQATALCE